MKSKFPRQEKNQEYALKIFPSGDSDLTCETSLEFRGKLPQFPQNKHEECYNKSDYKEFECLNHKRNESIY